VERVGRAGVFVVVDEGGEDGGKDLEIGQPQLRAITSRTHSSHIAHSTELNILSRVNTSN